MSALGLQKHQPLHRLKQAASTRSITPKRKLIGFDPETWQPLDLLSRDSGWDLQGLAKEAFTNLLANHNRPRTLKDAVKQSTRREPTNENRPPKQRGS